MNLLRVIPVFCLGVWWGTLTLGAQLQVNNFNCIVGTPSSTTCQVFTKGRVDENDVLVIQNAYGIYSVSSAGMHFGVSTIWGLRAESYFLPKVFRLEAIRGAVDPVLTVECSEIENGLGIPYSLSGRSSRVRILSWAEARKLAFFEIAIRVLLVVGLAAFCAVETVNFFV